MSAPMRFAEVRRLFVGTDGTEIVTTVTTDASAVTFDTYRGENGIAVNLTEDECKTLISNLVASLNAYQRHNRAGADQ